ncbi:uncharacterized protein LOC132700390 isoform X2 [Cylas formicarius]|uniref:uncharacterized protein LOC132700390 isoform X2 n=1 Tax=Cylas formicarius TaxID=197179 RepID=UPI00295896F2|nr:uncharacterized protein LOC132700390 isoform X2 [Cylas formicarius]
MGQCTSRKAAGAFAASAAVSHKRPKKMHKIKDQQSPDDDNNKRSPITSDEDRHLLTTNGNKKVNPGCTKGVAMSFGFKRRVGAPSIASNASAARRLANSGAIENTDRNGNEESEAEPLTSNIASTGRSTPRLAPPKKEANASTRVSRFGFRQNPTDRLNKVADLNSARRPVEFGVTTVKNVPVSSRLVSPTGDSVQFNGSKRVAAVQARNGSIVGAVTGGGKVMDNNRNVEKRIPTGSAQPNQTGRFTFQTNQLPRPESIKVIESKTAKTLANNHRRFAGMYQQHHQEETASKDGSLTEDSGVGSHFSGYLGENDGAQEIERLNESPTFGARWRSHQKPRNLEVVTTSKNTFDVRDMNDSNDSIESCAPPPLPQLPSAFNASKNNAQHALGLVRERTIEYQRHIDWENRGRKISATSSEGFSDDYGEEEKTFRDKFKSEKCFIKTIPHKTFLKSRANEIKEAADSSPPSSDEQDWVHGGEAMADDISFTMSSSDESKDKRDDDSDNNSIPASTAVIETVLQTLGTTSSSFCFTQATRDLKSVFLTFEDPNFAAVAASSTTGSLLDDEILSPVESLLSCSDTEELVKKKLIHSSSNSKDVNENLTPTSPAGTPTNATNSLSLSDGKDDFLIDDEIADQPALVFEDTITNDNNFSTSQNNSENTPTIKDATPKPRRKVSGSIEGSPLNIKSRKFLQSRTGSLDTLSPCESIASDDLMMDYDVSQSISQSSGLDDCDRHSYGFPSLQEPPVFKEAEHCRTAKDWIVNNDRSTKSTNSRARLLSRSRTGTPNSVPDSPRSLDSRINLRHTQRPSSTSSPIRSRFSHLPNQSEGLDSDNDSIRLDRTNHTAIKQDIVGIKTMLLKLRRVLNESDTHNPFENQVLANGLFNTIYPTEQPNAQNEDNMQEARLELADLRRQVIFLQGQLEDKEKAVQHLQEQVVQLVDQNYQSNSAPASTITSDSLRCNAATQTDRIRPISAGPSLLNGSSVDGSPGSLVSANESSQSKRHNRIAQNSSRSPTKRSPRLWCRPDESPSPQRYASSIPRRATSRSRTPASISS